MKTSQGTSPVGDLDHRRTAPPHRPDREMGPAGGRNSVAGTAGGTALASASVVEVPGDAPALRLEVLRASEVGSQLGQVVPLAIRINEVHKVAPWSRSTTYALVKTGRLRAKKLGRCTFVLRADLLALLEELEDVVPRE